MRTAPSKTTLPIFYVYEHWRPDTNECFLVGKGHARRAWRFSKRNAHHTHIVRHLRSIGLEPEVRVTFEGLTEKDALDLEVAWIAFWRKQGMASCNFTDGGEGVCGLVHSDETRKRLSVIASKTLAGRPVSPETRERIAAAQRGKPRGPNPEHSARLTGRRLSPEHRAKIGAGQVGRVDSPETREKRAAANRGRKADESTRLLLRLSHLGKKRSPESLAKQSETLRATWAKRKAN